MMNLTAYRAFSNSSWVLLNPEVSQESGFYQPLNSQFDVDAAIISKIFEGHIIKQQQELSIGKKWSGIYEFPHVPNWDSV